MRKTVSTRNLAMTAVMAALSVVLTRFASVRITVAGVEGIRLGLGALPNIVCGFIVNPLAAGLSGGIADIAGFALSPLGGAYMPHFTLTAALAGAIPGLVYRFFRRNEDGRQASFWNLVASTATGAILVSLCLTPYFLHTIYKMPYQILIPPRLAAALVEVPIYSYLLKYVLAGYRP